MEINQLRGTSLRVTPLCIGATHLGGPPQRPDYAQLSARAASTLQRIVHSPINFIDTSNNYTGGDSERQIGNFFRTAGKFPPNLVLATKVDPLPGTSDFSGDRVRRSLSESLERLGLNKIQLVYLHDPERITFSAANEPGGPVDTLARLRDEGIIEHIGVAGGPIGLLQRYLATGVFEVVLSHNRYTVVDISAQPLIDDAARLRIGFINAAPFGGGILAKGPELDSAYCYQEASPSILARIHKIKAVCISYEVPMAAAALQYSLRNKNICSTVVGVSGPDRIDEILRLARWSIPDQLWSEIGDGVHVGD
jgi:D-threo-aldose 1-dehydrogenase